MVYCLAACDACINMGRDVILSTKRFISSSPHCCAATVFIILSSMCHRCRESRPPKPTSPRVPARGRGRIRFLKASSQLLAGRLLPSTPGVSRFPSTVSFFFLRADNPTVSMFTFFLLFVLAFFLLLALDVVTVSDLSASLGLYICNTWCWSFSYCRN